MNKYLFILLVVNNALLCQVYQSKESIFTNQEYIGFSNLEDAESKLHIRYFNNYRISDLAKKNIGWRGRLKTFDLSISAEQWGNKNFNKSTIKSLIQIKINEKLGFGAGTEVSYVFVRYDEEGRDWEYRPKLGSFFQFNSNWKIGATSSFLSQFKKTQFNGFVNYQQEEFQVSGLFSWQDEANLHLNFEYVIHKDFKVHGSWGNGRIPLGFGISYQFQAILFRLSFDYHYELGISDYAEVFWDIKPNENSK